MDLRVERTRRNIVNAFISLRAKKPIEKITVKELAEIAEINKATFYLHYKDIYDLSEKIEMDIIDRLFESIGDPELVIYETKRFTKELFGVFYNNQSLIKVIFSGSRTDILINTIEKRIREYIFTLHPELTEDAYLNIMLTYTIRGSYYAFNEHIKKFGLDDLLDIISTASVWMNQFRERGEQSNG